MEIGTRFETDEMIAELVLQILIIFVESKGETGIK